MIEKEKETPHHRILRETGALAVMPSIAAPLTEEQADVIIDIVNKSLKAPAIVFELDEVVVFSSLDLDVPEEEADRLVRQLLIDEGYDSKVVDEYIEYKRGGGNAKT